MSEQLPPASFIRVDDASNNAPTKTSINQYIDILRSDISNVENRKNYEVFVTGSVAEAEVKSGLFQTVFDQDFTLSTANPLFDISVGLYKSEAVINSETRPIVNDVTYTYDGSGKITGFSNELMIREKVNVYRQFAKTLLGDANLSFVAPHFENRGGPNVSEIKSALFVCFRRLFTRDNIVKGSFTFRVSKDAAYLKNDVYNSENPSVKGNQIDNIEKLYTEDSLFSDADLITVSDSQYASTNISVSPVSGEVTTLTATINGNTVNVGLIYYDKGIIVLDTEALFNNTQTLRGKIDSTQTSAFEATSGPWYIEHPDSTDIYSNLYTVESEALAVDAKVRDIADADALVFTITVTANEVDYTFYQPNLGNNVIQTETDDIHPSNVPQFVYGEVNDFYSNDVVVEDITGASIGIRLFEGTLKEFISQASIDDILNHFCLSRFGDEQNRSSIIFQNETIINSKVIFCRASPTQLNYSTNPTYINRSGEIIAKTSDGTPFSYITTVGLYDSTGTLVAVAKTSRPIEKNPLSDITINVRLDF